MKVLAVIAAIVVLPIFAVAAYALTNNGWVAVLVVVVLGWFFFNSIRRAGRLPRPADKLVRTAAYERMAREAERAAAASPSAYRRRVVLFALVGYAYIGGALVLAAASILLALALLYVRVLGLAIAAVVWGIAVGRSTVASLFVRIPRPDGMHLELERSAPMRAVIEEVRIAAGGPAIHEVLLVPEANAAVTAVPRLGVLGWNRNHLLIGLPVLLGMPLPEFRAVLAHEFGHLSARHDRIGSWIYRMRRTWVRLREEIGRSGRGMTIFRPFFEQFAPRFAAYSLVLARLHEHEADRIAAQVAGTRTAADALTRIGALARHFERDLWPSTVRTLAEDVDSGPFSRLRPAFREPIPANTLMRYVNESLACEPASGDTHPSLMQRLEAYGVAVREPPPFDRAAGDELLGDALDGVVAQLDAWWHERNSDPLRVRRDETRKQKDELARLESATSLGEVERLKRATLVEQLRGSEAAEPLYAELVGIPSIAAPAAFALGRILVMKGDGAGAEHLERAVALDPDATIAASEILAIHYAQLRRPDLVRTQRERIAARIDVLERAGEERRAYTEDDELAPHGLDAAALAPVRRQLAALGELDRAYYARKKVRYLSEQPYYVLAVRMRRPWYFIKTVSRRSRMLKALVNLQYPGATYVVMLDAFPHLERRFRDTPDSLIYERSGTAAGVRRVA